MPSTLCHPFSFGSRHLAQAGLVLLTGLLLPACSKDEKPATAAAPAITHPPAVIPANASPVERILLQARAALGTEEKLTAVTTLELSGNFLDDKGQPIRQLVIMFKKPARMRSEVQSVTGRMIQGSDGVSGWEFDIDPSNNKRNGVMPAKDEMQNIYETLENLYFFRGTEHVTGASVTADGEAQYHNAACWKVSFHYPGNINYVRYFDRTTGKLIGTVLEPAGDEFIEEGENVVNGITFPRVLREYSKSGQLTQTITFDKVIVNQPLDDRLFDQPSLIASFASPPAASGPSSSAKPATSSSPTKSGPATPSPSPLLVTPPGSPLPKSN